MADGSNFFDIPPRKSLIECTSLKPIGAENLPPRQWAYGRFLLFGSAAVLGGVDGGGKGTIAVAMALAMITGGPLLGEHVWRTGPVAIVTYEDDETEWHRRIAAACLHYELDYENVLEQVHFIRNSAGRLEFAVMGDRGVQFPYSAEIIDRLRGIGAVLLIVDPFNHAHTLDDGNNNVQMAKVAGELSAIAYQAGCAVLVLHHLRKGASGDPDDLMGATSLRATFRSCRILARMTLEAAQQMQITDPWRYNRIAGSKENYAPPPERATWFKLASVSLGNATDEYPDGDEVAVATSWQPRKMFDGMDVATLAAVFTELRQTTHGPTKQAKHTPWAGKALVEIGRRSQREAAKIVAKWLKNGVLIEDTYYHSPSRHHVKKVTLDETKVAQILDVTNAIDTPAE